jgi:hypothetical protein
MQFVVLAATCLNVAEIQVFSATPNPNAANALALVSYKKACAMSSAYGGASPSYPCSNAVDGNLLNFVHTNAPPTAGELAVGGPWYQIDLGYSMTVSQITIYDRADCCQNRLDGGRLFVGNYAGDQYAQNAMCPGSPYVLSTITAAQAATQGLAYAYAKTVPCSLTGRFVIFQTPYNVNNPMNLGELQVWSKVCPARTSVGAAPVPGSGCAPECGSVSGIQAEGTFLTLIAPLGCRFTSVAFASFGTPSLTSPTPQSPYSYNSACHSPNSLAIAASCVGLSSCTISVALASFGSDPCFGVAKSLAVTMTTAQPTVGAGALCVHQCSAGYVPVSGAASAVCSGGVWSQPPLNCAPTCDDVPAPANAAYGVQTYFVDDFNVDGSLARLLSLSPATQAIGYPSNNPPRAFLPSARACNVPPDQPAQPLSRIRPHPRLDLTATPFSRPSLLHFLQSAPSGFSTTVCCRPQQIRSLRRTSAPSSRARRSTPTRAPSRSRPPSTPQRARASSGARRTSPTSTAAGSTWSRALWPLSACRAASSRRS